MGVRKPAVPLIAENGFITVGQKDLAYTVLRSARRKRTISFRLDPQLGICVRAPARTKLDFIHRQLESRKGWFAHKLAEGERYAALSQPFTLDNSVCYLGHACALVLTQDDKARQSCRLMPRRFILNIPEHGFSREELAQETRTELLLWLKKRARAVFKKRMDVWAKRLRVTYKNLSVTNPRQQWGSCNGKNDMRLSWRLILAPLPLLDYVVAHELCHVLHKNHGVRFWRMLENAMPDYQQRRKRLRLLGPGLTL